MVISLHTRAGWSLDKLMLGKFKINPVLFHMLDLWTSLIKAHMTLKRLVAGLKWEELDKTDVVSLPVYSLACACPLVLSRKTQPFMSFGPTAFVQNKTLLSLN